MTQDGASLNEPTKTVQHFLMVLHPAMVIVRNEIIS